MSSTIIYAMKAFKVAFEGENRFAVAAELGASNCTMFRNGREVAAREWQVMYLGSSREVIVQALDTAAHCEGGMVCWRSRRGYITPEQYLTKVENQLSRALPLGDSGFVLRLKQGWKEATALSTDLVRWLSDESSSRPHEEFWPLWTDCRDKANKQFPPGYAVAATYGMQS